MQKCKLINVSGFAQSGKTVLYNKYLEKDILGIDFMHLKYAPVDWRIELLKEIVNVDQATIIAKDPTNFELFYKIISNSENKSVVFKTTLDRLPEVTKYKLSTKVVVRDLRLTWMLLTCEDCWDAGIKSHIYITKRDTKTIKEYKNKFSLIQFEDIHPNIFTEYDKGLLLKLSPISEIEAGIRFLEQELSEELSFFGYKPFMDVKEVLKEGI